VQVTFLHLQAYVSANTFLPFQGGGQEGDGFRYSELIRQGEKREVFQGSLGGAKGRQRGVQPVDGTLGHVTSKKRMERSSLVMPFYVGAVGRAHMHVETEIRPMEDLPRQELQNIGFE
jgi:hypothetical protein